MTRPAQKQSERAILDQLLRIMDIQLAHEPEEQERPDFLIKLSNKVVGVEVTRYQSKEKRFKVIERRKIEAEWERFIVTAEDFRNQHEELNRFSILFIFKTVVPPQQRHLPFLREILQFVRSNKAQGISQRATYWAYEFPPSSSLMIEFLRIISIARCGLDETGYWDSNITGGFIQRPATTIARILEEKSAKAYKAADELWLVIQRGTFPSETILPFRGVIEFNECSNLQQSLARSPFVAVYVFTALGLFVWQRASNKWGLANEQRLISSTPELTDRDQSIPNTIY